VTFARFDVIVVPFPFTDRATARRRPALVLSEEGWNRVTGHVVASMITTAAHSAWSGDVRIGDIAAAGLQNPCVVRWKLFTLETGRVVRRAGALGAEDRAAVERAMMAVMGPKAHGVSATR
jgi:mRNA interferase MazF